MEAWPILETKPIINRKKFLFSTLATWPLLATARKPVRDTKGIFVASGGTRLAESIKLKGINIRIRITRMLRSTDNHGFTQ
jgi:hypothetical protein